VRELGPRALDEVPLPEIAELMERLTTAGADDLKRAVLDAYVKKFLVGTGTDDTNMLRADNAKADLGYWMEWTAPKLQ